MSQNNSKNSKAYIISISVMVSLILLIIITYYIYNLKKEINTSSSLFNQTEQKSQENNLDKMDFDNENIFTGGVKSDEYKEKILDDALYDTGITYEQLARYPNDYYWENVTFSGKVIQVIEDTDEPVLRIAVDDNYDTIIMVYVPKNVETNGRILENDYIIIRGYSVGLVSYSTVLGNTLSIPGIYVEGVN